MSRETVIVSGFCGIPRLVSYDAASEIGQWPKGVSGFFGRVRLPGESIGTSVLTLTNVAIGSAIRIEVESTGALVELRTAASTTEVFTLDYYSGGAAANDLVIKVRKASAAPLYKPFQTLATIGAAAQSIYIAQIPD